MILCLRFYKNQKAIFMKRAAISLIGLCMIAMFVFSACNKDDNTPAAMLTLYDSLGGTTMVQDPTNSSMMIEKGRLGIRSVVDSTIFVIAADTAINGYFTVLLSEVGAGNLTGFQELSKNLTDFFCVATGAKSFSYTGLSMTAAHDPATNTRITDKVANDDFDAFILDLVKGAQKNGLPDYLITRVGEVTETTRTTIVQR